MTKRLALLLSLLVCAALANAQSITTYAGGGTADGHLLSDFLVSGASATTFDSAGNLYVTLSGGGQVIKVDAATSVVTTIAGVGASGYSGDGSLAVNAALRQPHGIAFDSAGNLYIADSLNNRIRKVDAKGIITTFAGGGTPPEGSIGDNGPATSAFVSQPWGMVIDRGALYFTETAYDAHHVRKVDLTTNVITTIAGTTDGTRGGFSGDGGPAKDAQLNNPYGITVDADHNLYINDVDNKRIRRIDANGIITTYAGGGAEGNIADGIPATQAFLDGSFVSAVDRNGNLLVDSYAGVRRIDKTTKTISTVFKPNTICYSLLVDAQNRIIFTDGYTRIARFTPGTTDPMTLSGDGTYIGDGLRANAAILHAPQGLALDRDGNLYIVDQQASIIRKVSATDRTISTVAGKIGAVYSGDNQDGLPATQAAIGYPTDIAFDAANNMYIADELNQRIWRVEPSGTLTSYAGGGTPADGFGDNGLATQASIVPWGISFDNDGNLLIADDDKYATIPHARVRRIDSKTKIITTVAGSNENGYSGDDGPATQAKLDGPRSAVVDNDGNIFISDGLNGAIRRVDKITGKISTYAGHLDVPVMDNIPASQASIDPLHLFYNHTTRELYFGDHNSQRVRKINRDGIISTVAGSAEFYWDGGFAGDDGPATAARLSFDYGDRSGVVMNARGDLFFSDGQNNRVRALFACGNVSAPQLQSPSNNATSVSTGPHLTWSASNGAFRYDVLLDTVNPPQKTTASDVAETSLALANLKPSTTYYWKVTAKGDRFCPTTASAPSAVASFTTVGGCAAGAFDLTSPANNATGLTPNVHLTWQPSTGALTYDVYLGATNPPALFAANITQTSFDTPLIAGHVFWFVVAHAACDPTETATSPIRSFTTGLVSDCIGMTTITPMTPADGADGVSPATDLSWNLSGDVDSVDVYFGTTNPPPIFRSALPPSTRTFTPPLLSLDTTYYWRIGVNSKCLQTTKLSAVQSFSTLEECRTPGTPSILFAPSTVNSGSTYALVWSPVSGVGTDGGYLVERSTLPNFATLIDSQITSSTAASFLANASGTIYHRVRAVAGCNPNNPGPASETKAISITEAPANVIFTVSPQALVIATGDRLEDHLGTFTLENISNSPIQVIVGRQELGGSQPFFSIVEEAAFVTLQAHTPRTFTIRYSGPSNQTAASYQGVIFVAATGQGGLAVTPYAFVNLKVGGGAASQPQFVVNNVTTDYAAFDGFSGDDANRAPLSVTIKNNGTAAMDLAADIGPEVWLTPQTGWNSQPLAPGATRTVNLLTDRSRAPNGSPLPRYTYFTVRTKDGASARLLVQDNDRLDVAQGRTTVLDSTTRSFVIPEVTSRTATSGRRLVTRMRLTNLGSDAVQAEVIYTPSGIDGFDATNVVRAIVVVPANDVVTITDPIVQLFRLPAGNASGSIEVRLPRERVGLIAVRSSIVAIGGAGGFETPVVARGEGARAGSPHVIYLPQSSFVKLTLAETSGNDAATVSVIADDGNPATLSVPRYGTMQVTITSAQKILIGVTSGGGSVIGVATIANSSGESGATLLSRAVTEHLTNSTIASRIAPEAVTTVSVTTVVPVVKPSGSTTKTSVGLVGLPSSVTDFVMTYHVSGGSTTSIQKVSLPAGGTKLYSDLLAEVFNVSNGQGSVFVDAPSGAKVYAVMGSGVNSASSPTSSISLPTTFSEALTGFASAAQRVLSFDGLEQSTDPTRGDRWLLALNEVAGSSGTVNVRLYEAGNRTSPIATRDFTLAAYQQLTLDGVFTALGLDSPERRKDRTNVQVVVIATAGKARVAASAIAVNAQTSETRTFALTPAVGSAAPNVTFVTPVITQGPPTGRRRAVGH